MPIIKLNAIESTNTHLRHLITSNGIEDFTTVFTKFQLKGRGRMGTVWTSERGKNLLCSVYKDCKKIDIDFQFYISMVTSLAIMKGLNHFNIPKSFIKWPNDILSENKKICGILIENVIKNNTLEASIIGIGLNVNQKHFKSLVNASSLKNITGKIYDVDELLDVIINALKYYFKLLENKKYELIKSEYETLLFRKDKPSTFKDAEGNEFPGFIQGVSENGNLIILMEDEVTVEFESKQIALLY